MIYEIFREITIKPLRNFSNPWGRKNLNIDNKCLKLKTKNCKFCNKKMQKKAMLKSWKAIYYIQK